MPPISIIRVLTNHHRRTGYTDSNNSSEIGWLDHLNCESFHCEELLPSLILLDVERSKNLGDLE